MILNRWYKYTTILLQGKGKAFYVRILNSLFYYYQLLKISITVHSAKG